jgi:hypothetical protein
MPYRVRISIKDLKACFKVCQTVGKKLKDTALVDSVCAEHKISIEKLEVFTSIFDLERLEKIKI